MEWELGILHGDEEVVEGVFEDDLSPAGVGGFIGEGGHVAEVGEAEDEVAGEEEECEGEEMASRLGVGG